MGPGRLIRRSTALAVVLALAMTAATGTAGADDTSIADAVGLDVDAAEGVSIERPSVVPPASAAAATPVATDEPTYQAFGRVFPDPHGCFVHGDAGPPEGTPVSPWAKGTMCATDYLGYTETVEGATFLSRRFPDLVEVIRLDERYDDPSMRSAGIARPVAFENGEVKVLGRDKSPLYMFKVTDRDSQIAEEDREHFVFSMAIHGLERAGLEGGVRAMEDLVTWAACEKDPTAAPACDAEGVGSDGKPIVEGETDRPVPTAGEALEQSVLYFVAPNPDGWRHGEKRPAEVRDGNPNANYLPGPSHSRRNGHGPDLNRDWPTFGYTLKSHQPWSEPETRAFGGVLSDIRDRTSEGRFAAGIDLHGMLTASAFSYTLLGADQRDYRKNAITVETSLRTYEDQTQRLTWSPYIGDSDGDGEQDRPAPLPVADEWGTIFDTLGYTITGGFGPWMDDSRIGLGGVGINNEMALSHIAPNNVYEPALVQTHIDGNKGLIYSQISALLHQQDARFEPTGQIGYVDHDLRLEHDGEPREQNPGLPAQPDIDVLVPCQGEVQPQLPGSCGQGTLTNEGSDLTYEFDVHGPDRGFFNGGMSVISTAAPQFVGHQVYVHAGVTLERLDEESGDWQTVKDLGRTHTTLSDPQPGHWRLRFAPAPSVPRRIEISFDPEGFEEDPGQLPYDASNLDFFDDLNDYVAGPELQGITAEAVAAGEGLDGLDTLVVANDLGRSGFLSSELGLDDAQVEAYFANLAAFAEAGGNLVLTDGALHALADLGVVESGAVADQSGLAGFYGFNVEGDTLTYEDPETYPLARGVDLPGAAENTPGNRQAVEPTTLGFSPEGRSHAQMPFWGVERGAWEARCDKAEPIHCTTATTSRRGSHAIVGEVGLGDGVVRIAGSLLPNPNPVDDDIGDHRFGLGSYALSWTGYRVFENLVDWQREGGTEPPPEDDPVPTELAYTGDERVQGNAVELAAELTTAAEGDPVADRTLTFAYDGETYEAVTGEDGEARTEAPAHSGREATVEVTFEGDDDYEPAETSATISRRGNGGGGNEQSTSTGQAAAAPADGLPGGAPLLVALALAVMAAAALTRRLVPGR